MVNMCCNVAYGNLSEQGGESVELDITEQRDRVSLTLFSLLSHFEMTERKRQLLQ